MSAAPTELVIDPHPSFNYDHCEGEAAGAEEFASWYFGAERSEEIGDIAYEACVAQVDLDAANYWSQIQ